MEDFSELKNISLRLKRMSVKVKLISLISKAKSEYDSYDYESGMQTLLEAYALAPENPAVLRGLGCMHQFKGEFNQAIEYFEKALQYSEAKEVEYTLIGMAYYLQDRLDEAIENFNLAIENNDNYDSAYEGRNQAILENHLKILDLQEVLKKYF